MALNAKAIFNAICSVVVVEGLRGLLRKSVEALPLSQLPVKHQGCLCCI
jgi:hypothetical protein